MGIHSVEGIRDNSEKNRKDCRCPATGVIPKR